MECAATGREPLSKERERLQAALRRALGRQDGVNQVGEPRCGDNVELQLYGQMAYHCWRTLVDAKL
jgi:hypothetical protein